MTRPARLRGTGSDLLVQVWHLVAAGRSDEARQMLMRVWCQYMDAFGTEQGGRVALRLFERLGFCTDAAEKWEQLPAKVTIYRAGPPGLAWSTERETVERLARQGITPVRVATVAKGDVLAYITERGEDEILVRPDRVKIAK